LTRSRGGNGRAFKALQGAIRFRLLYLPSDQRLPKFGIGEIIGSTRSQVSTFMNKFRKLGFIDYNGDLEVHNSLLSMVLHETPAIKVHSELEKD
jgi:hypothetical protein